jgi:hypothetical protein
MVRKQDLHGGGIFFKRRKKPQFRCATSLTRLIDSKNIFSAIARA